MQQSRRAGSLLANNTQRNLENSRCDYGRCLRITSYVVALILLIGGIVFFAKSLGNGWGGGMIGAAVLLVLVPHLVARCKTQKGGKDPVAVRIPTYDEMLSGPAELAKLLRPSDTARLHVTYRISSDQHGMNKFNMHYGNTNDATRRAIVDQVRERYAKHVNGGNLRFYIRIVFEKSSNERCSLEWGDPANLQT